MKEKKITRHCLVWAVLFSVLLLAGCNKTKKEPISRTSFKLNTVVSVTIYDKTDEVILDGCLEICDKYENIYSRTKKESELYQLNQKVKEGKEPLSFQISEELAFLIERGLYYSKLTDGAMDITIEPLSSLWNFTASNPQVPDEELLKEATSNVNYKDVTIDGTTITFSHSNMGIDVGAIAKGYIADKMKEYLIENGVKSAMINLGGNVLCVGEKTNKDDFLIGIQKPFADRNETAAVMELKDVSVVSSGIYERFFEKNGKLYHHILNPKTGFPYENNLIAVTIISNKSIDGDALSTSCFSLGLEKGLELINSLEDTYAVFITDDYKLHYSKGFKENIKINES